MKKITFFLLTILSFTLTACNSPTDKKEDDTFQIIKIGVVGENNEHWETINKNLEPEGIKIELVKFADYTMPNQALADKEIDLNAFQHHAFLENEINDKGLELSVLADTFIAPLGVYSDKITGLDELKANDKIAIPNDATNGGRSLVLLETAGIITLNTPENRLPEVVDIVDNPLHIEFIEVEAAQTHSLLQDVSCAIINGGHAVDNGLTPEKDSVYLESASKDSKNPYINIIACRSEDLDNPLYARLVEVYHTEEVADAIREVYKGAYIPTW